MDIDNKGERAVLGRDITESIIVPGDHNVINIVRDGHSNTPPEQPKHSPTTPAWNVPHPRNPFFTGREDVLTQIHAALSSGKPAALTQAISGLGGIGKTQTAVEYAYRHRTEYTAVLWLSAATPEILTSGFSAIARLLALLEADARDQSVIVAAVQRWLAANTGWLLILDNADDISLVRTALLPISPLFGHVLITTRATALGGVADPVPIEKLAPEDGAIFLLRRARRLPSDSPLSFATDADRIAALALSGELGGLPLALDQAGAYIEEMPSTPQKYLALYRTSRAALLKKRGSLGEPEHVSVTITFTEALKNVERAHPTSAELLRLCAFLAPDAIPEVILTKGADELGVVLGAAMKNDAARAAAIHWAYKWSLLDYDADKEMLSVHRLVQAVIQEGMEAEEGRMWVERAVLAVNKVFPRPEFSNWPMCEELWPHAEVCVEYIAEYTIETGQAARLLNQTALYMHDRADYESAEQLYKHALAKRESMFGANHPETAASLGNLAGLYLDQGNYAASEPLLKRALTIDETVSGAEHPDTAFTLNSLAALYTAKGDYAAAEPFMRRAMVIREKWFEPEHPGTAEWLNSFASLYYYQGKYAAAEPLLQRAMMIREKWLGPEHPGTAESLHNLASLYYIQSKLAAAEPLYERSLAIRKKTLGLEHPLTAISYWGLAALHRVQGSLVIAAPLYEKALTVFEKTLGSEHTNTTKCLEQYVGLLRKLGRNAEAEELESRAITGREAHRKKNEKT